MSSTSTKRFRAPISFCDINTTLPTSSVYQKYMYIPKSDTINTDIQAKNSFSMNSCSKSHVEKVVSASKLSVPLFSPVRTQLDCPWSFVTIVAHAQHGYGSASECRVYSEGPLESGARNSSTGAVRMQTGRLIKRNSKNICANAPRDS